MTLFLPDNFPEGRSISHYSFDYNETHMAMPLDYGSLMNHHESFNAYDRFDVNNNMHLKVREVFFPMCECKRVFTCTPFRMSAFTCEYLCIHTYTAYACMHITILKAKRDIAAGQEIFVSYGGPQWFEAKNIPQTNVGYTSTRWRPELQPLPCRKNVVQTTGADGRRSYVVREAVPSGAVLEISLCLEVPVIAVDQFPFLWDFVLTRETGNVHACGK